MRLLSNISNSASLSSDFDSATTGRSFEAGDHGYWVTVKTKSLPPIGSRSHLTEKLMLLNISQPLELALEKRELDQEPEAGLDNSLFWTSCSCQNSGCDAVYQGSGSDATPCTYHPGAPQSHKGEGSVGYETDFSKSLPAFCRHNWYQTDSLVVVYKLIPLSAFAWGKANQTELDIHIVFDGNCVFQAQMNLWGGGVISLIKADSGSWAQHLALAESRAGAGLEMAKEEPEDSEDDLSWTEEEEEEAMRE
ncbi:LOW QUALITY PROTEIN: integrin beta-1-binding protein 2 [Rhynchocyon petersi]